MLVGATGSLSRGVLDIHPVAQFFDILIVWSAAVPPAGVTLRRRFLFAISRLFRRLHTLASLFCTERQLKCFFFNSLRTLAVEHPGGGTP